MPSRKTSSLKPKAILLSALGAVLLLAGCMAVDESRSVFDIPLASDYRPTISRDKTFTPKRILVLPVTGSVDPASVQIFETEMLTSLGRPDYWTVVYYAAPGAGDGVLNVSRYDAYRRARAVGADAILFVDLSDQAIYSPLRIAVNVSMERVETQVAALNGRFDFDTRNRNVTDSARRYYQQSRSRTLGDSDAPDKSLAILNSNSDFVQFAGAYTARLINEVYVPQPTTNGKAQAQVETK